MITLKRKEKEKNKEFLEEIKKLKSNISILFIIFCMIQKPNLNF